MRALGTGLAVLFAVIPPLFLYAWCYIHLGTAIAGFAFLAFSLVCCVGISQLWSKLAGGPPNPIFGCSFILAAMPGIYLSLWVLVPFCQLEFYPPVSDLRVDQALNSEAQFFTFPRCHLRGDWSYFHRETRRKRNGESYSSWEEFFPVAPLQQESERSFGVWLVSRAEEPAFLARPELIEDLSTLKVVGKTGGFERAVTIACEKHQLEVPEKLLLVERSSSFVPSRKRAREKFSLWVGLYALLFGVLGIASDLLQRRHEKAKSEKNSPSEV